MAPEARVIDMGQRTRRALVTKAQEARDELIASRVLLLGTIDSLTEENSRLKNAVRKLVLENARLLRAQRLGKFS